MDATSTRRLPGPGLTGEDWWGAFELRWSRGPYRILAEPEGSWGAAWNALPPRRVSFVDPHQPQAPWVFERRDVPAPRLTIFGVESSGAPSAGETAMIYKLGWPLGGIFVPEEGVMPRPRYDPVPLAAEILLDAQQAATADAQGLLDFVNRWGCLGVGIPGKENFGADGVGKTGEALRELAGWVATLHGLQYGKPATRGWADLIELFESRLSGVRLSVRRTRGGLVPHLPLVRLLDALYLELWGVATGGKRLRRCKRCEHFFIRGREDQIFCTGRCARLWHVRRWKQRHRRAQQRRR